MFVIVYLCIWLLLLPAGFCLLRYNRWRRDRAHREFWAKQKHVGRMRALGGWGWPTFTYTSTSITTSYPITTTGTITIYPVSTPTTEDDEE